MRLLNRLTSDPAKIYDICIGGIEDAGVADRFINARTDVLANFQDYVIRADTDELFTFAASAWGNETQHVLAGVSKKEFVDLYSKQMAEGEAPGRGYYDQIMMLAPLGKCPFCGFGHATTLDHFLSKARYPSFSILPANLVPACTDCNKGKGAPVVTQDSQILHPYFEEEIIEAQAWLFAEVIEAFPASVRYFVQPPNTWPPGLARRLNNYFNDLDLARRYSIEAATELSGLTELLGEFETQFERHAHLSRVARVERRTQKNSWKAALYEALAENEWYEDCGYRRAT